MILLKPFLSCQTQNCAADTPAQPPERRTAQASHFLLAPVHPGLLCGQICGHRLHLSDHEDLHPCWRFRGQEGDFFSGEYVCIWAVSPVQSLGMLAHRFKDETAMLAESVLMKEGSVERGWERDRRRNTTKVQLAFCSEIIPFLTDFPLW